VKRRTFITGLGAAVSVTPGIVLGPARGQPLANPHLTKVNPEFLVTPTEARTWHAAKDSMGGPTMTGSPSWRNYLAILEKGLRDSGCVGIPGVSTMGSMTAYWSTKARMDYLDADHFVNQVATMCQLCGELMIADVAGIKS
jgi:hypothetical protein